MKIILISRETYDRLKAIQVSFPKLTFQNEGYQYIDKSKLTSTEFEMFTEVSTILRDHIQRFTEFNNFKITKKGEIQLRFQYKYDESFVGVGYILLDELLNGFNSVENE